MPTLRSRFDAVVSENVSDGRIRNVQAEVGQGSLDAVVAPCGILPGHTENELGHLVRAPLAGQARCLYCCCGPISWR